MKRKLGKGTKLSADMAIQCMNESLATAQNNFSKAEIDRIKRMAGTDVKKYLVGRFEFLNDLSKKNYL